MYLVRSHVFEEAVIIKLRAAVPKDYLIGRSFYFNPCVLFPSHFTPFLLILATSQPLLTMRSSSYIPVFILGAITLTQAAILSKRDVDFYNPTGGGGSFLDTSAGLGEPLNVSFFPNPHR